MTYNVELKNAVFTKDSNYAYKIRQKCSNYGIEVEYIDNLKDLISYFIRYKMGIVFIDLKYSRFTSLIKEYIDIIKSRSFVIIFLNDHKNINIGCDNRQTYLSCYDRIINILPTIITDLNYNLCMISKDVDSTVVRLSVKNISEFKIPVNLNGYSCIKECVVYAVENNLQSIVFNRDVYPAVATRMNTKVSNVEKSMRDAIKKARLDHPECFVVADERFKHLTVVGFLSYLIEKVRMNLLSIDD